MPPTGSFSKTTVPSWRTIARNKKGNIYCDLGQDYAIVWRKLEAFLDRA